MRRGILGLALAVSLFSACTYEGPAPELEPGQDVHLTFLHTADWHSRLFPYEMTVGQVDRNLGLSQENEPFGGAARIAHLIQRERQRSGRVLHLDSGDVFQGAPIFNFFQGEAETRALAATGVDAMVIGNHEFDAGGENLARQLSRWATFPVLAANYKFKPFDDANPEIPRLGEIARPYAVLNARGLKVGVIGMGNLSSLTSIYEQPNSLGIVPLESVTVAQFYIDYLRPRVDLIVMLTHSGVTADNRLVRNTTGIDVVLGGHLHVVLNPPQVVKDCAKVDEQGRHYIEIDTNEDPDDEPIRRYCRPREVVIAHSGAFIQYLGRLDLVLSNDPDRVQEQVPQKANQFPELRYDRAKNGYEVVSHDYQVFPVDSTVPKDPRVEELLEPYEQQLPNLVDLDQLVGYAPKVVRRFGTDNGDSPLGNLIAQAMLVRAGVETDFALTNTTGIRADFSPGPVSVEQLFNVFPFDNSVTTMFLSGREIREMFNFVARKSASRGCQSQAQIAGARAILDCSGEQCPDDEPCAPTVAIGRTDIPCSSDADCEEVGGLCDSRPELNANQQRCLRPLQENATYELATSDFLAGGGSGFRVLQRNTTSVDTGLPMRQVLADFMRNGEPCGADEDTGELPSCSTDSDCAAALNDKFVCACPQRFRFNEATRMCVERDSCPGRSGQCVLESCRNDVAEFRIQRSCADAIDPLQRARCECDAAADAGEECKFLACIDEDLGARSDGRIKVKAF